jgi:hypothetical protein
MARTLLGAWLIGLALAGSAPASAQSAPVHECPGRVARFFTRVTVRNTSCAQARRVIRKWVKRSGFGQRPPRLRVTVLGWTCRLKMYRPESDPYGRITCTKGNRRIRFYGYS